MPNTLESHLSYTNNEWNTIEYFKNVVNFLQSRQIKNILDAGGCSGRVTTLLIEKIPTIQNATILEPISDNYNYIIENCSEFPQVNVVQKALFYGKSHIQLGQCDDNVGGWSFQHNLNKTTKIETITLEKISSVDFLKMDIEGAEKNVIENSDYIHDIPYLEIEFHDDLNCNFEDYVNQHLKNHILKFNACPERSNAFFVRRDLFR